MPSRKRQSCRFPTCSIVIASTAPRGFGAFSPNGKNEYENMLFKPVGLSLSKSGQWRFPGAIGFKEAIEFLSGFLLHGIAASSLLLGLSRSASAQDAGSL